MSWSLTLQSKNVHGQLTVLIGSAIRLLGGECGVFSVSNEAFDPRSGEEYALYQLTEEQLPALLASLQAGQQPGSAHPFVVEPLNLAPTWRNQLFDPSSAGAHSHLLLERCSLFLNDQGGLLGLLHFLRPLGSISALEAQTETLDLYRSQLAASLRFALAARSLFSEQERLAAIFQNSTEGLLTVDSALRIIDFNPAMERLTGWREAEVLGRFYHEVLRPKDRQGIDLGLDDSPLLQAFANNAAIQREMLISARDGQRFTVMVTASIVYGPRREPLNGILTIRDITREREQEEQRSTFISIISHELQTPIAIIKGYASTLARQDATFDPQVLRTRLVAVEEEADRLNKLVGNLLYATRIEAGGLHMEIAPLDLNVLIESVIRRFKTKIPEVSLRADLPPKLPLVMGDRDRIEEVLQNLLDNAVKYSPKKRSIEVTASAIRDEVIVGVNDSGMGIALRDQLQIFDRFHRVQDQTTSSLPGAGLGLYICRAIIEAHGGRIWVESTLLQGSTFSFSLPREEKAQLPMVVVF